MQRFWHSRICLPNRAWRRRNDCRSDLARSRAACGFGTAHTGAQNRVLSGLEHAQDVLDHWLDWQRSGGAALIIVTATEGGAVRAPGAMMAVSAQGARAGYISGGCLDADVAGHALAALRRSEPRWLCYGAGSPFIDLPLPCGGRIELAVLPAAGVADLRLARDLLAARQPVTLRLTQAGKLDLLTPTEDDLAIALVPKLRLRIAGRGADSVALARLAVVSGYDTRLMLRAADAAALDVPCALTVLHTPAQLPGLEDDPWTAFLLAFHDPDWEVPLIAQALSGPAFHIGAVGSRRAQDRRRSLLRQAGVSEAALARLRGPVGLVPSLREASMLAVSVLAEIVESYHARQHMPLRDTALVLLAAGASRRFEGDKLMAPLSGRPLLAHVAGALRGARLGARIAVVPPDRPERAALLAAEGWQVLICPQAAEGQGASLAAAIAAVAELPQISAALVILGDMPGVSDAHLMALRGALSAEKSAVMSESASGQLLPPAIFAREVFDALMALGGDQGARRLFPGLARRAVVRLAAGAAQDIDTRADLALAEAAAQQAAQGQDGAVPPGRRFHPAPVCPPLRPD